MKKEDYMRMRGLLNDSSKRYQSSKGAQKHLPGNSKMNPPCKGCSGKVGKPGKSEKTKKHDRDYYKEKMLYCKKKYEQCSRYGREADMCRDYYRNMFKEYKKKYFACDK